MDRYKLEKLEKELDAVTGHFRDMVERDYEMKPPLDQKEYTFDISLHVFYALEAFKEAILKSLQDT